MTHTASIKTHDASFWPIVRALFLVIMWLTHGQTSAQVGARHEPISIVNDALRIAVDARDGRLLQLIDLQSNSNLVGDTAQKIGLWKLIGMVGERRVTLEPNDARTFRIERMAASPPALRLIWSDFEDDALASCSVIVTIRIDERAATSRWTIRVLGTSRIGLEEIFFPRVGGLRRQEHERLAVPLWMGQELPQPRQHLCGANGRGRRFAWSYPGTLSMQFLAYYRLGGCGFYAATNDTSIAHKTFAIAGTRDRDVHFEMIHDVRSAVAAHDDYRLPYDVVLGTFLGDWITAAERYRTWAVKQPWTRASRLRNGLVPQWVAQTGLWIWNRGRSAGVLSPAKALHDQLELPVNVFWHWWHGCPYDIGFPEYFPPREGTEAFQKAVTQAHQDGTRMLIYMNQRAWGMSTASWKAEGAERFAVKGKDGKVRPEVYNVFTRQALASMCLATPFWRQKYASLAQRAFQELKVDGIYMDQACSHKPCYDPNHDHPVGGGDSWINGFRALALDIRNRCDGDRKIVLAGEGCGEAWLPFLDLMLALQVSRERYAALSDPWQVIPMFHAVYHPYAITYGNYSSLTMPPYDDLWPTEFAPTEPLALLDRTFSRQFYLEQARTFVWGQQLTLANFRAEQLQQRSAEIAYLMRLARVRNNAKKYLLYGEFLRAPQLNAPVATFDFSRLSIYAGQNDRLTSFRKEHALALAGAWRAANGDVAIALTSIADRPISLCLKINERYYRLPAPRRLYRIDENGRQPFDPLKDEQGRLQIELPPRAAWIIEFSGVE